MAKLKLNFGLEFADLYEHSGVNKIDREFLSVLEATDSDLHHSLLEARNNHHLSSKAYSDLIINLAPHLEKFMAKLFGIEDELQEIHEQHLALDEIYKCKRLFVQRQAVKDYANQTFDHLEYKRKLTDLFGGKFDQITFARNIMSWLNDKESHAGAIEIAKKYAAWATLSPEGQELYKDWVLFQLPKKRDPLNLVNVDHEIEDDVNIIRLADEKTHSRDDFNLTDPGPTLVEALDQAHYCIFCHKQSKDSCSKGFKAAVTPAKAGVQSLTQERSQEVLDPGFRRDDTFFKHNIFGEELAGCPLEEKISEMNLLKSRGLVVAPLATAVIDNPMVAATGDRICNDCMKSCIYQKQDPVDIPKVESRVLHDVLSLPWGFEIYSLLTRWNPLNVESPIFKPDSNRKVLIAGLGPAGFTLSHYLLNEGHTVVAIDGLKIEPSRVNFEPIRNINELFEELDDRPAYGFGGVAEYGITVRWNKNFLKIIRLLLERRTNFKMYGGVRFGSQINYDSAFALGFDHIALALGAGKPNLPEIPNRLALGIKTASDFLMSLQLTGAAKQNSIANLQIRLPLIVIGGGLTAVDTATEAITYYIRQVAKFKQRYDELVKLCGAEHVKQDWSELDSETATEFLEHAALFEAERAKPKPNFIKIIRALGGVRIFYRKLLTESPSYRLNPEEMNLAFKEGIEFVEEAVPIAVNLDINGNLDGMKFQIREKEHLVKAKSVLLAIGTSPNTVLHREDPAHFSLYGKYFTTVDENGKLVLSEHSVKPKNNYPLMSIDAQGRAVSFFGDLHPSYAGNVVKAMASAKNGYKIISKIMAL